MPVLFGTGCNNSSNQASASLPPSNPAIYPASLQAAPAEGSIFAENEAEEKAPPALKFKPFVLRDGETLASYEVGKGDTLSKIAKIYGTSVSRIQSANGLESTKILDGKTYKIPTMKSDAEIAAATGSSSSRVSITASKPEPPSPPSFGAGTMGKLPSTASTLAPKTQSYTPPAPRTFSPPPTTDRPTFTPRTFDYSGPTITSPSRSASSIIIATDEEESDGSGSAFPTPTFGSGSSF